MGRIWQEPSLKLYTGEGPNAAEWIEQASRTIEQEVWLEESRVPRVILRLRGVARTWADHWVSDYPSGTFCDFQAAFVRRFVQNSGPREQAGEGISRSSRVLTRQFIHEYGRFVYRSSGVNGRRRGDR